MRHIKNNAVYLWQQEFSPVLRWFVLAAYCIGYVVLAVAIDPITALLAVLGGTIAILGLLATLLAVIAVILLVPLWLMGQGFNLIFSQRWWLGLLAFAAAYAWTKLPVCCDTTASDNVFNNVWLYIAVGLGWCLILIALYFYTPSKRRA